MQTGIGYDVHRLVEGRKLIVGGVIIPYEKGLLGHSDADVLLHAVCDALLGACGLGDLGEHFPDSNPQFKGADSSRLLAEILAKAYVCGLKPVYVDTVIIAEAPKMAPYKELMKKNIATLLKLEETCVNIKATTEEGLGFTGTKEGMAAWAVVTVAKINASERITNP